MTVLAVLLAAAVAVSDGPEAIRRELHALQEAKADHSSDPRLLLRMADLYLDLGDEVLTGPDERRRAYEEGARVAQRALAVRETDAEAHYLYAANLGSAAQLTGMVRAAVTVRTLKRHVARALELQPDYAPALHMMGMLLQELPWVLGGDRAAGLRFLQRAAAADPDYAHVRLDLARIYVSMKDRPAARRELEGIIAMEHPRDRHAWKTRYVPEATRMLADLDREERGTPR
jgi:tetratricopeptide (TPR) repeat protein